jgi:molybdopterin molybdotransferase
LGRERISVDEGLALIRRHVRPSPSETITIGRTLGRVTASPVYAGRTVPAFRAAAMDGYAVRSEDVRNATADDPISLPVAGRASAGTWPESLRPSEACSIGTGAPVPEGADSVIMIEQVTVTNDQNGKSVSITSPANAGLNIRQTGEDAVEGERVLEPGKVVTPDVIAGLTAYGVSKIEVAQNIKLALIVTGSELAEAGSAHCGPAGIIDSNGPMIRAYAAAIGASVLPLGTVEDAMDALVEAFDRACATEADIVLTTGGASHGEHDFVRAVLERRKAQILFDGLSMRPGKPILFALLADGRPFFGLPGNPVAACVGMRFFVAHAIRVMLGLPDENGRTAHSNEPGREGTTLFFRGLASQSDDHRLRVDTGIDQRSHILSSLMAADSWLRVDRVDGRVRHLAFSKSLQL